MFYFSFKYIKHVKSLSVILLGEQTNFTWELYFAFQGFGSLGNGLTTEIMEEFRFWFC